MKLKSLIIKPLVLAMVMISVLLVIVACKNTDLDISDDNADLVDSDGNIVTTPIDDSDSDQVIEEPPAVIVIEPTYGGTIKLAMENPTTMSPIDNTNKSVDEVLRLIYEPLFKINEQFEPVPVLVESYEYDAANKSLAIRLKADILFHDGSVLTTNDVKYTIDQMKKNTGVYASKLVNVAYMTIVDDNEMIIYFDENYAFYLYDMNIPIVSKAYNNSDEFDPLLANGTGPYKEVDFTAMQNLKLEVFEGWHEAVPYISQIECVITREESAERTAFEQALIDMYVPSQLDWRTYSEIEVKPIEYTTSYLDIVGFNFQSELLNDIDFRQAIAYAIDREAILSTQYLDHGVITDGILHPDNYLLSEDDREIIYDGNLITAKALLDGVDLVDSNDDGFFEDPILGNGENIQLRLLVNSSNQLRMGMAEMIMDDLAELGIELVIDQLDREGFYAALDMGDYDLVLTGWKISEKPDYMGLFHSKYTELGYNFINYSNLEMDLALEAIYTSSDVDILKDKIEAFNDLFATELPYFPIAFSNSAILTNEHVYGLLRPSTDDVYNNMDHIYIYDAQ